MFDAATHGNVRNLSYMIHEIVVEKADSGLTIEFFMEFGYSQNLLMLLDFERMPTRKRYLTAAIVSDNTNTTTWISKGGRCKLEET